VKVVEKERRKAKAESETKRGDTILAEQQPGRMLGEALVLRNSGDGCASGSITLQAPNHKRYRRNGAKGARWPCVTVECFETMAVGRGKSRRERSGAVRAA